MYIWFIKKDCSFTSKNNEFMDSLTYKCSSSTFLMNVEILTNTCYSVVSLLKCKSINSSWFSLERKLSHSHTLVPKPPLATLTTWSKRILTQETDQISLCVASRGKLERWISLNDIDILFLTVLSNIYTFLCIKMLKTSKW